MRTLRPGSLMQASMMHRYQLGMQIGDPGLLKSIGRAIGGVAKAAVNVLPGPVGAIARTVMGATAGRPTAAPGGMPTLSLVGGQTPAPGIRGAVQRALPGGASGFLPSRRMNYGNAKAARRAIRRIKGVRSLLQSIERQMPKRKCTRAHRKGR